jgi:hypothetical protein
MNKESERLIKTALEELHKEGLLTRTEKVELCDPVVTVGEDYTITVDLASMFKNFSHETQEVMYLAANNLDRNDIEKFNYNDENYIESVTMKG